MDGGVLVWLCREQDIQCDKNIFKVVFQMLQFITILWGILYSFHTSTSWQNEILYFLVGLFKWPRLPSCICHKLRLLFQKRSSRTSRWSVLKQHAWAADKNEKFNKISNLIKIHSFLKQCFFPLWKQGPSADDSRG